jgi:twitching motility protein PilT
MSFPSEIQPSVRAQLADCLVAVCCQRLDFLAAHRLHVPRCELLLPTSGAKGTIRGGNFSQLATVLQSGGDEGMWTFDRYQRWMDQVTDWVRPPTVTALRGAGTGGAGDGRGTRPVPGLRAAARPPAGKPVPAMDTPPVSRAPRQSPPSPVAKSAPAIRPVSEDVIEVPAEDMDLASLAELAKKVVDRKP